MIVSLKTRLILILLICCSVSQSQETQQLLLLKNSSDKLKHSYKIGSYISLQTYIGKKINGRINQFVDNGFIVAADTVLLKKIKKIYIRNEGNGAQLISNLLLISGAGYATLVTLNRYFEDQNPIVEESTLQLGIVAIGTALLIKKVFSPTIKIKERDQLQIIKEEKST
jgi:hypothetical protein